MIYLDNNATTRPSPAAADAADRAVRELWHNPSSVHRAGQAARQIVELARQDVAELIGGSAKEVTFTSSGTEAIDLAIRGILGARRTAAEGMPTPPGAAGKGPPVVVTAKTEHAAVRDLVEHLASRGEIEARWAAVGPGGVVSPDAVAGLIDERTALVSVMWANNETGAINPVREIGVLCRSRRVVFHCDGVQWAGKEPMADVRSWCDLLSLSPHKFHGVKGVGVLWTRRGIALEPRIHGTQELGRRGGTENVPGIAAAGVAAREAAAWLADAGERARIGRLRDDFERAVIGGIPWAVVNGAAQRLWNTCNIGFPRLEAEALLLLLSERGICASAGAACSSGSLEPSPVLLAMGIEPEVAHGSVRLSLSKETTAAETQEAAGVVVECVRRLSASLPHG